MSPHKAIHRKPLHYPNLLGPVDSGADLKKTFTLAH